MGTTSCKCVLFDERGSALASGEAGYELHSDRSGAAEQNLDEIFDAVGRAARAAVQEAPSGEVSVISFSAAMHSLMAMGDDARPLTPLMTYADTRAAGQARRLKESGGAQLYRRTGTPFHAMTPLSKLVWLQETQGDVFGKAALFCGIKEWILFRLCGRWVVDHSIASATGLLGLEDRKWDGAALEAAGLTPERLPELVGTTDIVGELSDVGAEALGLPRGTPLVAGGADGCLASLGSGAIQPGATTATIGTSGAVRTVTREPALDPHGRLFCFVLTEDRWVVGGALSNGGLVLDWVRDLLAQEELASSGDDASYQVLLEEAGRIEPGAGGVLFLPYLVGERAPYWNAEATGVLMGLRLNHQRAHIVRAALEGVIYGLRSIATLVEELVPLHGPVRATGGFSRSKLWLQMLADVLGREVEVSAQRDASPLGAAVLGLMAVGAIDSIDAVDGMVEISSRASPDPSASQTYDEMFERFVALYGDLEAGFERMAALRRDQHRPAG